MHQQAEVAQLQRAQTYPSGGSKRLSATSGQAAQMVSELLKGSNARRNLLSWLLPKAEKSEYLKGHAVNSGRGTEHHLRAKSIA